MGTSKNMPCSHTLFCSSVQQRLYSARTDFYFNNAVGGKKHCLGTFHSEVGNSVAHLDFFRVTFVFLCHDDVCLSSGLDTERIRVRKRSYKRSLALITCLLCHKQLEIIQRSLFPGARVLCAVKLLVLLLQSSLELQNSWRWHIRNGQSRLFKCTPSTTNDDLIAEVLITSLVTLFWLERGTWKLGVGVKLGNEIWPYCKFQVDFGFCRVKSKDTQLRVNANTATFPWHPFLLTCKYTHANTSLEAWLCLNCPTTAVTTFSWLLKLFEGCWVVNKTVQQLETL